MDDGLERDYAEAQLSAAKSALAAVDGMISGEPDAVLSVDDLGWLRVMLLDQIEVAETKLGVEHSQTAESVARTVRLGLDAGILAALEDDEAHVPRHLPEVEDRELPGVHWLLHMPCPECGNPGVEQTVPGDDDQGDHRVVTVHPDRDRYDSPIGTRGGYTQIDLWCPAGHQSALVIANHKGDQYIGAITAPREHA